MSQFIRPTRLVAAVASLSIAVSAFGTSARAADEPAKPAKDAKPAAQKTTADKAPEKKPEKKDETFLDPEKAGLEYKLQGEYAGDVGSAKLGVQVIALGGNKFHAVFLPGGLPGDGWDGKTKVEVDGKGEGEQTTFEGKEYSANFKGDALAGKAPGGNFEFKRITRRSPTEGAKPPEGAVILFDGTNADAFPGGHMDERKLLFSGPTSKQSFKDYTLHVEFLLPFKPYARGQERGNSGVYMQNRYEVQVLDSFGLKGANNECGGIYSNTAPSVNMCYPPLQWQTYDIEFTGARYDDAGKRTAPVITVKHNGVMIHDKVEIKGPTGGGKAEDPKQHVQSGQIQLQGHGNPVFYRNVWIVEKKDAK